MLPEIENSAEAVKTKMRRRRATPQETLPKVGFESSIKTNAMKKVMSEHYSRRRILEVPDEILDAHPDKHFVFLNMPRLEKNGFWSEGGYELLKSQEVPNSILHKFNKSPDGYIHRNEMVLAYISKEEHERRELERQIIKGKRDISEIISKRPELSHFGAHARVNSQVKQFEMGGLTNA